MSLPAMEVRAIEETLSALLPELVSVTFWGALVALEDCMGNSRTAGPNAAAGAFPEPVPLIANVCGYPSPLSLMVRVAMRAPSASGANDTERVQLPREETVVPQLSVSGNSGEVVIDEITRAFIPGFVSVMVCGELVEPTAWDGKTRDTADTSTPAPADPQSAALASVIGTRNGSDAFDAIVTRASQLWPAV